MATAPPQLNIPEVEGTISSAGVGGPIGGGPVESGAADAARGVTSLSSSHSTLDEPVTETIMRDLRRVYNKLKHVLLPGTSQKETLAQLRDWDLWGPLLLCMVLSVLMSLSAPEGQASLVFASVFVVVWAGAAVVTFNAKLLGGNISFFQSVCVLGYCVCPLVIAAVLCFLWSSGTGSSIWKAVNVILGTLWSTRASIVFMSELVPDDRRALAVYPVILFYIVIAWMVAIQ